MSDFIKINESFGNTDEPVFVENIDDRLLINLGPGGQLKNLDSKIKVAPGTGGEGVINAVRTAAGAITAVEYNIDVINKVISDLESLAGTEVQDIAMQTTNLGDSVGKMNEYFTLYNEIHHSLHQTIKNILKTVTEVRDEAAEM